MRLGSVRVDPSGLTREQWAAVSDITIDGIGSYEGSDGAVLSVLRAKLKLLPRVSALEELLRHLAFSNESAGPAAAEPPPDNERREKGHALVVAILETKSRGNLPPEVAAAFSDWARTRDSS